MSFEGYYQVIYKDGSYDEIDCYFFGSVKEMAWYRLVDCTNGWEEDNISTQRLNYENDKVEVEKQDHYGNKYFEFERKNFRPKAGEEQYWRKVD
jgi:hypothetical protein